jgi:hypothetical protein
MRIGFDFLDQGVKLCRIYRRKEYGSLDFGNWTVLNYHKLMKGTLPAVAIRRGVTDIHHPG